MATRARGGARPTRAAAGPGRTARAGPLPVVLPIVLACVAALAIGPAGAQTSSAGPEIRIADNVFVVPDARARSVTGWLLVKAGCADEAFGNCRGLAHYLEHLLFINRDNEHRSKVALFSDGSGNGWTNHRTTGYFQRFPARAETNLQNVDKLLGYFAGLLTEVKVEPDQADRERNVVLQEYFQTTGRNPYARFGVRLSHALMPNEPLGQRVIGTPETIKAFTVEAARDFHAHWYARNNAVIVLHGPIDAEAVKPLVARHIDPLPVKPLPPRVWTLARRYESGTQTIRATDKEARQTSITIDRIVLFQDQPSERRLSGASRGVLSAFLSSRLQGSLLDVLMERDSLVTSARLSLSRVRTGAIRVSFSAVPADGVAPDQIVEAARAYVAELARTGIGAPVVERLKRRIANDMALLAEQPAQYADALVGWLGAHDSYENWLERRAQLDAVTAETVKREIDRMAAPGREVVGIMLPSQPQPAASASGPAQLPSAAQQ